MKVSTRLVLVLAMISALLAGVPGAGAQDPIGVEAPGEESELRSIVRATPKDRSALSRNQLGFPDDEASKSRAIAEGEGNGSRSTYGFNLTDDELKTIEERLVLLDHADDIRALLYDMDGFGEMWLDHDRGKLILNFKQGTVPDTTKLIERLVNEGLIARSSSNLVDVDVVAASIDELFDARDQAIESISDGDIQHVGISVSTNKLQLTFDENMSFEAASELVGEIIPTASKDVEVALGFSAASVIDVKACTDRINCGGNSGRRAGVGIHFDPPSIPQYREVCTTAWAVVLNGDEYIVTAGHCFLDPDTFVPFTSGTVRTGWNSSIGGGQWFGTLTGINYYLNPRSTHTTCDCRLIQVNDSKTFGVLYRSNNVKWLTMSGRVQFSTEGDIIKMFGGESHPGSPVGEVTDVFQGNFNSQGVFVDSQTFSTMTGFDGDSGAAVSRVNQNYASGVFHSTGFDDNGFEVGVTSDFFNLEFESGFNAATGQFNLEMLIE